MALLVPSADAPAPVTSALVGSALVFFGGWVLMALAESWEQNRQHGGVAKALKSVVLLAAQSASAVGNNVSVPVVGLSAGKRFLAYLLLCCSGSLAALFAAILIAVHQTGLVQGQWRRQPCWLPGDWALLIPPTNKSQQYAADGRRTPFPWLLRRHSKVAAVLSVKFGRVAWLPFPA